MAAFMKLKAENASKAIVHSQFQPEADGYMKLGDIKGEGVRNRMGIRNPMESATKEVGWWTVDGADFRGIQQDALTKGGQEGEKAQGSFGESPVLEQRSNWDVICDLGTAIKQDGIDLQSDALVQQVNGTIGYAMQASIGSEHWPEPAAEMFATGSAVDSWIEKTFGNGDGEILGGISQGNVFAPINVLRNGYDCEGAGAC